MVRCINIDWLECYCLEDFIGYPHDAEYFRRAGFRVIEREYGTPVYHEMFTVISVEDDQPFIEVRRRPKSAIGRQINGVLDPMACHIRLTNRACYFSNAADIMQGFIEQYGFHFQRISRVDICLDFERFDYGDDPARFMDRFFRGKYSKINQCRIRANGRDMWDGRIWNSVTWAGEKSMIGTKFYNKTMELRERADKPYIRQAWRAAGLVDDDFYLTKAEKDGTTRVVDVWRVEFSIKSSTRKWFVIEDNSGKKQKLLSKQNTLDMYKTRQDLLNMFFSLTEHYFHFKRVEYIEPRGEAVTAIAQQAVTINTDSSLNAHHVAERKRQRKDRCSDKLLFRVNDRATFYKLENIATAARPEKMLARLEAHIRSYQETHYQPEVYKACEILIEQLEKELRTASLTAPWPMSELTIIRQLIARRIKGTDHSITEDTNIIKALYQVEETIFGEVNN